MYKGRIGRLAFFLGFIYLLVPILLILALLLGSTAISPHGGAVSAAISLVSLILDIVWLIFFIFAAYGLIIRRWHDMNQSGWLSLLQLIPLVSFVTLIIQLFVPGTNGPNQYGDQTVASLAFKTVLFGQKGSEQTSFVQAPVAPIGMAPEAPATPPIQPDPAPTTPATPAAPAPSEPSSPDQPQV